MVVLDPMIILFLWDGLPLTPDPIGKTVLHLGDRVLAKPIAKAAYCEQIFGIARIQL